MTHGTRDGFQSPKTFEEVGKEVLGTKWQERGLAPPLAHRPSGRETGAGGRKNRPNHAQNGLVIFPVLTDNKQKTRLAASI